MLGQATLGKDAGTLGQDHGNAGARSRCGTFPLRLLTLDTLLWYP